MTSPATIGASARPAIGIWVQWPKDARWSNEGMTRLLGFLIEGIAIDGRYTFRIVLPDSIRDAAESDLRTLCAKIGKDFTLHSPRDAGRGSHSADLADYANNHVPVDAWLSLFPYFALAERLEKPVTVIFPDAIPKAFHEFEPEAWNQKGFHAAWEQDVARVLAHARRVITFSDHVARDHVHGFFGFADDKIAIVPHAAPDLQALLPFLDGRERTPGSLSEAADLLRRECDERKWENLRTFPFEEVPYLVVSTQDRVTKNVALVARAQRILLRELRRDVKLIMTTPVDVKHEWALLGAFIDGTQSQHDIVAMPDLSRLAHAALLHCAAVAIHPSIFEGGHAPFPFYEAVSVGTPCLFAAGPHISEIAEQEPNIRQYCFDWNDADGLSTMICDVLERRPEVVEQQQKIYERLRSSWSDVAEAYSRIALEAELGESVGGQRRPSDV